MSRNYRYDGAAFDQAMREADVAVRHQDLDAIREIETQLARPWTLGPELLTKSDGTDHPGAAYHPGPDGSGSRRSLDAQAVA